MLAALPEIFILSQVASVAGIKFSELAAKQDFVQTNVLLINILKTLFVIIIPIALIMVIANKEIIQIAFERGNFQKNSITTTAFCFFYFSLLLPSKIFDVLFTRLFTSFQLYGISTLFAVIAHSAITLLLYFLTTIFQLQGYFITLLIGYYLVMPFTCLLIVKFKMKSINIGIIIKDTILLLLSAVAVYFLINYIFGLLYLHSIPKIFILSILVIIPYFLLANWMVDLNYQKKLFLSALKKNSLHK